MKISVQTWCVVLLYAGASTCQGCGVFVPSTLGR